MGIEKIVDKWIETLDEQWSKLPEDNSAATYAKQMATLTDYHPIHCYLDISNHGYTDQQAIYEGEAYRAAWLDKLYPTMLAKSVERSYRNGNEQ